MAFSWLFFFSLFSKYCPLQTVQFLIRYPVSRQVTGEYGLGEAGSAEIRINLSQPSMQVQTHTGSRLHLGGCYVFGHKSKMCFKKKLWNMKMSILYLCYSKKLKPGLAHPVLYFCPLTPQAHTSWRQRTSRTVLPRADWGRSPTTGFAFHPSISPGGFRLNSLIDRKRFLSFELPAVFFRKPFTLLPGWTGGSAPKGSLLSQRCPLPDFLLDFSCPSLSIWAVWHGRAGSLLMECFSKGWGCCWEQTAC